jgi:hypothetical protein
MTRHFGIMATMMAGLLLLAPAFGQGQFDFMPDGGRGALSRLGKANPSWLSDIATQSHDLSGWEDALANSSDLTDDERSTLAGYLSVNLPLEPSEAQLPVEDLLAHLPKDGKELAVANCQYCHSIFTGYLVQDRDLQGWRSVFLSPFHRDLKMTDRERETFALYSAENMPLKIEDVPPELRF